MSNPRLWGIVIKIGGEYTHAPPGFGRSCDIEREGFNMITKDTIIGDILDMDQNTAPYFLEIGMHCLGCPASRGETLEQACAVHGTDVNELVEKLNAHFAG